MNLRIYTFLFGTLLFGAESFAQAEDKPQVYFLCKNKEIVRTIRVHYEKSEEAFVVTYTKNGKDSREGSGKSFEHCRTILNNIRINLEKNNNWACRDISPSRVVSSENIESAHP